VARQTRKVSTNLKRKQVDQRMTANTNKPEIEKVQEFLLWAKQEREKETDPDFLEGWDILIKLSEDAIRNIENADN
jgi:hypothetical protein